MDVKEKLINNILLELDGDFEIDQLLNVKRALTRSFSDVRISNISSTESTLLNETDLLKKYILNRKLLGRSESTISLHVRTIKVFLKKVGKNIEAIETNDIRLFILNRKENDKLTDASISREQYTIANFFRWMYSEEIIDQDPIINLNAVSVKKFRQGVFTETEVEILRKSAKKEKERMIIELLLCTGCQVSELVSIKIEDYDMEKERIIVRGSRERFVFVNAKTKIAIADYLQKVQRTSGPLILGLKGNAMSTNGVQKMLKSIAQRGNIKEVYPQKFRRTSAVFAFYHGMELNDVRLFLGHKSINTTQRYIIQDIDTLRLAHNKYVSFS